MDEKLKRLSHFAKLLSDVYDMSDLRDNASISDIHELGDLITDLIVGFISQKKIVEEREYWKLHGNRDHDYDRM